MQQVTNYQQKVFTLNQTLKSNLYTDYEGEFNDQNAQSVLSLFKQTYEEEDPTLRLQLYCFLKSKITDQKELRIIDWFQKQRGFKYSGEILLLSQVKKKHHTLSTCLNPDALIQTRITGFNKNVPVEEITTLDPIHVSESYFMKQKQPSSGKQFLYRKIKQRQPTRTPWVVQKTKDHRYVWRARISIDRVDVMNLLTFILLKRSPKDQCPSLLINTGSHGDDQGNVASDTGDFTYTAQFIHDETLDSLSFMIKNFGPKLRINKANIEKKVCLYFVSTVSPCVYPERADHIIDTQCYGAYRSVKAIRLHPPNSFIEEKDLMFLQGQTKSEDIITVKKTQIYPNQENSMKNLLRSLLITQPMKILTQESAIIRNQYDAYKLCQFFKFPQKKGFFDAFPKVKIIKKLNLLFRASEHNFSMKQYFKLYGKETDILFICLTEKNKIIGAYSPLSHEYKGSIFSFSNKLGEWVEDHERHSFIFSVTNNQKFALKDPSNAIFRLKDKSIIGFGCRDFSICDNANTLNDSATCINYSYINHNYEQTQFGKHSRESCLRFNGNEGPQFLVKQWQAWKVQLQSKFDPYQS